MAVLPCRHPVTAYPPVNGQGRWAAAPVGRAKGSAPRERPCGQCVSCRLNRRAEWSLRMQLEAKCHEFGYFVTLTYAPEHLPEGGALVRAHPEQFLKRFRSRFAYHFRGALVRHAGCGEYGEDGQRPHYHVVLYTGATSLPDLYPWRKSDSGHLLYRSPLVEEAWGMGHVEIGSVTEDVCDYVAGYILKKQQRGSDAEYLARHCDVTGKRWEVPPEFAFFSRRPGIGMTWFQRFPGDVLGDGKFRVVLRGGEPRSMPVYFLRLLERSSQRVARGLPAIPGLEAYAGMEDVIRKARDEAARDRTTFDLRKVGGSREALAKMHADDRERVAEVREYALKQSALLRGGSRDVL